jgi:hypothetical protein
MIKQCGTKIYKAIRVGSFALNTAASKHISILSEMENQQYRTAD